LAIAARRAKASRRRQRDRWFDTPASSRTIGSRATHSHRDGKRADARTASVHSGARVGGLQSPIGKHEIAPTTVASTRGTPKRSTPKRSTSTRAVGRTRRRWPHMGRAAGAMGAVASCVARLMDRTTRFLVARFLLARFWAAKFFWQGCASKQR
jgi:hypothetical protein